MEASDGLRSGMRSHIDRHRIRPGQHLAAVPLQPAQQHLRLAHVPCDDGMVQGLLRPHRKICRIHDAFKLRHLYRSLSDNCIVWLSDEDTHPDASGVYVPHPYSRCFHPLPSPVRNPSPHTVHKMVCAGRKSTKSMKICSSWQ